MGEHEADYLRNHYTKEFKIQVCKEHISEGVSLRSLSIKHKLSSHSLIHDWLRRYKFIKDDSQSCKILNFSEARVTEFMNNSLEDSSSKDFERLQLEKRISELEKQLKEAEMKAIAYATMVDIAEKELKISIRKKFNTKP